MACSPIYVDGKLVGIACGSSWGIGTYEVIWTEDDGATYSEPIYGFPPDGMNPYEYRPDRECCTAKEIAAWEEAKHAWDAASKE